VVLTGGDPFMNRPTLTWAIDGLGEVPHVETLRVATRSIAYHPALFTARDGFWLSYLKRKQLELEGRGKKLEVATHFIHPDEISVASLEIIAELVGSGVKVYVQTPFLGGCNDSSGTLAELFRRLRAVGAELHYIYMPCSPLQGNRRYRSVIASGLREAAALRARLSDRALPKLCTATAIGKIDWGINGWAVEEDATDRRYLWFRTPYTKEFFEAFAPILNLSEVARENSEGTLDAKFMASVGDQGWLLGPREALGLTPPSLERERFPAELARETLERLQRTSRDDQDCPLTVVPTGSPSLHRVHPTRFELDADCSDDDLRSALEIIAGVEEATDVVVFSRRDTVRTLYRVGEVVERLRQVPHVTAVRLRSFLLNPQPKLYNDAVVKRLASLNRLAVTHPTRLEIETRFLHSSELTPDHVRVLRALRQRGVTVYNNTPLLSFVNDTPEELARLSAALRRTGIEFNHVYLAGLEIQRGWNEEHPVHWSHVIDLASHLRRTGSGRELPRYVVRTPLGEVEFGLTAQPLRTDPDGRTFLRLLAYTLDDFTAMNPSFTLPADCEVDEAGHLIVPVTGMQV
jgi:lysine 2,3-aminomutase